MNPYIREPLPVHAGAGNRPQMRGEMGSWFSEVLHRVNPSIWGPSPHTGAPPPADPAVAAQIAAQIAPSLAPQSSGLDAMLTQYKMPIMIGGGLLVLVMLLKKHKE